MWLHGKLSLHLMEPATAVTISNVNKIHWPVVLGSPVGIFDSPGFGVHKDQATRAQQRKHPAVSKSNVAVAMPRVLLTQRSFQVSPAFHHAREQVRSARIECWVKSQRHPQSTRRSRQVSLWNGKFRSVVKALDYWHVKPSEQLHRTQVVDCCQRVEFMQPRDYLPVFDIRQTADMENEFRAAPN
jgi:hypothetical protein